MSGHKAMGGHQSAAAQTTTWLTPPPIIEALGGAASFDLDPCAFAGSPIPTARRVICLPDDGLAAAWDGRVWLNPPYTSGEIEDWLRKLADHGRGVSLTFARTETGAFHRQIWARASGVLFLAGRLHFHHADGRRASANAGAPSVLAAYGQDDLDRLAAAGIEGALIPLQFPRFAIVAGLDGATWRDAVLAYVRAHPGPVVVSDLYRALARHPKAAKNPNWRAKVRQTLQRGPFERVAPSTWSLANA